MRVVLSGYYGFGNHGDEALLAGLIEGLRGHGHEPVVLSADPEGTRHLHGVEARARTTGLLGAVAGADALVSGGGGLLQDRTSARSLAYYLAVIRLARVLGKPAVVFGQSVGPLSPRGRAWVRYALRGVYVAVRDRPSRDLLTELGIDAYLTADAALALTTPERRRPAAGPERTVAIVPRAGFPDHTLALGELARNLAADGWRVRAVALHPSQDASEAAAVQSAANHDPPMVPEHYRAAMEAVQACDLVVSTRLHALVFAAAAGIPHVGLVYDPKVAGFLADSGGAAIVPPIDAHELERAARSAESVDPELRADLLDRARTGMAWLDARLRMRQRR